MNFFPLCPQASSAGHQNQQSIQGLPSSSTPVHAPLQYIQPGHSYPAVPYAGQHCAATPAPASLCSVNIQHTVNAASYTPPTVQQVQAAGSISASAASQNVAQSYQAPGHQQQQATAVSSLTFPLKVQKTCQNCAAPNQQQVHSASGYPAPVQQQTAAAAPTLPAQSYPLASVTPSMAATAQCHPGQAPRALQQVQGTVNLSSHQPGQSSSTPALYSQQIPIPQENQQLVLQNAQSNIQLTQHAGQAYIQPQRQQQVHTPAPQQHSQKTMQAAVQQQSHDVSQSTVQQVQTPASQTLPTAASIVQVAATHQSYPAAGLPDAASQSYAHSAFSVLQQQTVAAQSQYLPAQSTSPQTYGGANQVVTPQILSASSQHSQSTVYNHYKIHCSKVAYIVT